MAETKKRKTHRAELKAKVGLQALSGRQTINEIAQEHEIHPIQVRQWKAEIVQNAKVLFEVKKRGQKSEAVVSEHESPELLFSQIGRLKVELDWLKKKSGICLP